MLPTILDLYDLNYTQAKDYLKQFRYPWEALGNLKTWILEYGKTLDKNEYTEVQEGVWVHKTATVAPTAFLGAPCIVGARSEVRHCAFIRQSALIGEDCVVGNSVELKNVILFDHVQTPHYNYVGDSILGYYAHMGAGSITSNVKSDKSTVAMKDAEQEVLYHTNLKKCGAFLGDYVEIGCNSVLNPGTVIGRETRVYPLSSVRGIVAGYSIYKSSGIIVSQEK